MEKIKSMTSELDEIDKLRAQISNKDQISEINSSQIMLSFRSLITETMKIRKYINEKDSVHK